MMAGLFCGLLPLVADWLLTLGLGASYVILVHRLSVQGQPLGVVHPLIGLAGSGLGFIVYRNLKEVREKRRLRQAFQQYLHPSMVNKAMLEPGGLKLGEEGVDRAGQRRARLHQHIGEAGARAAGVPAQRPHGTA